MVSLYLSGSGNDGEVATGPRIDMTFSRHPLMASTTAVSLLLEAAAIVFDTSLVLVVAIKWVAACFNQDVANGKVPPEDSPMLILALSGDGRFTPRRS